MKTTTKTGLLCLWHIMAGASLAIMAGAAALPGPVNLEAVFGYFLVVIGVSIVVTWAAWFWAVWKEAAG